MARKLIMFAALAAVLGCGSSGPTDADRVLAQLGEAGRARGYNLLLITVDTLRADRLGCYGHSPALTPRIDGLAATGILFEQATASVPITLPSHATILTGLDPPNHGVRHNGTFRLPQDRPTMAEWLAEAGYDTGAFVGSFVLDARYGLSQGFGVYDDEVEPSGLESGMGRYNERSAGAVTDSALAWLQDVTADEHPFFAWVHYFDPHSPYEPPPEFAERLADPYDGEIAYTDSQIGRLLDFLRERGELERTLVVFTSDHGEALGQHYEATHADLIYDSTMHVPWIVSNPQLFPRPVRVTDRVTGTVDVAPTLLDLLGVRYGAANLDGLNPLTTPAEDDRGIYIETLSPLLDYSWAPLFGIRRLHDKFILAPTAEYYDLRLDPGEEDNLGAADPAARALQEDLAARLAAWPPAREAFTREHPMTPDEEARLASLGYTQLRNLHQEIGVKDPKQMMPLRHRISKAGAFSLDGEVEQAMEEIVAVLSEDPNDAKAWYTAAQIFERAGQLDKAESALRRAVWLSPRADGWVHVARFAFNRGDSEVFEAALAQAESLDPQHGGVHIGRGLRLATEGKVQEALSEFVRAAEIDPIRSGAEAQARIEQLRAAHPAN